jgi:hypothetical protein
MRWAEAGSSHTLQVSMAVRACQGGHTEPLPPDTPELLEVDLVLGIFEEILLPHALVYERGLEVGPPTRDLIYLFLS